MSRSYFIIMVYCLVCEHYQAVIPTSYPSARFSTGSDEEVITIEICANTLVSIRMKPSMTIFERIICTSFPNCGKEPRQSCTSKR